MQKVSIIIPAHNEEARIKRTLETYYNFFNTISNKDTLHIELVVVLNGCTDNTLHIVEECAHTRTNIHIVNIDEAGKGLAIKAGFVDALMRDNNLIGFVDADMATNPRYFYDLITHIKPYDGITLSRYMPGAYLNPQRPLIKTWGRKLIYNSLVYYLFNLNFYDYQCGAKLFKRHTIEQVIPHLTSRQWAFDVELFYLCKLLNFSLHEIPTTWCDQSGSKFKVIRSGTRMISALFDIKKQHKNFKRVNNSKES